MKKIISWSYDVVNPFKTIFFFYYDGFKRMKMGKTLWLIIAVKLFLFFFVMKFFFFQETLQTRFSNDTDRAEEVIQNLIKSKRE